MHMLMHLNIFLKRFLSALQATAYNNAATHLFIMQGVGIFFAEPM